MKRGEGWGRGDDGRTCDRMKKRNGTPSGFFEEYEKNTPKGLKGRMRVIERPLLRFIT